MLNTQAKQLIDEINKEIKVNEGKNIWCTHSSGKKYNFFKFANLNLFGNKIFNGKTSIEDPLEEQAKMKKLLMSLKNYDPSNDYKINTRKEIFKNAEDLLKTRNKIITAFEDGNFPLAKDVQKKETKEVNLGWMHRPNNEPENVIKKIRSGTDLNVIIYKKKTALSDIEGFLNDIVTGKINSKYDAKQEFLKKIQDDEDLLRSKKYRKLGKTWKLQDVIDGVKYVVFGPTFPSDEKPSEIIDMPELETEGSAEQRKQQWQEVKILTPKQLITRLPILLAQLKAGNNSEKLTNEIRQLLYSLYRSKKLSKTIYNSLINAI